MDAVDEQVEEKMEFPNPQQLPNIFDDLQKGKFTWPPNMWPLEPPQPSYGSTAPEGISDLPPLLTLGKEQQIAAVRLSHYLYTLMCIIWQQLTTIHRYNFIYIYCTH